MISVPLQRFNKNYDFSTVLKLSNIHKSYKEDQCKMVLDTPLNNIIFYNKSFTVYQLEEICDIHKIHIKCCAVSFVVQNKLQVTVI